MKKLGLVIMLVVAASGCAAPQGEHSAEIEALSDDWLAAYQAGDMDGILSLYAEDARLLAPNAEMMQGYEAIGAVFGGMIEAGLSGQFEHVETVSVGDVGYNVGRYALTTADGAEADRGKFMEVWRKVGDKWKMTYDMFSSDLLNSPEGAAAKAEDGVKDETFTALMEVQ